ncbi:MAG: hypothetical protein H0T89_29305 [Deltaproteobacteria bacterium]|nr:hypothetical protein [Deltaproteobacteria bacterium]MDQ3297218.1 hypothetical protein [Myxococcota bacterium]
MSRTRWFLGAIGLVLAARWCAVDDPATAGDPASYGLYTAIVPNGFLVMESRDQRTVREIDHDGKELGRRPVPVLNDVRVVGAAGGPAIAFIDNHKLVFGRLGKHGELTKTRKFGRAATELCHGAASNDKGFAVAWRESNGLGLLHGTLSRKPGALAAAG